MIIQILQMAQIRGEYLLSEFNLNKIFVSLPPTIKAIKEWLKFKRQTN